MMPAWPYGFVPLRLEEFEEYERLKELYDNETEAEIPVEDLIRAYERLKSVKNWYLMFNQNIDSEAVKDKLWEILKVA
ncbi:unnamed protein product [marine sediment metagenome]|uniref:Uncharacterized protein n=1 Tax=marine sediment metagenome TaxID=412755 RepID=X0RG75_9ZZZZ